ncbi:S8 family serine peptidase [Fictibacillus nanhaiensis]|uniref:S8 family serine peptidase n=1 Tax=Fictibacillus nanhaiensis TaxID=742169 RepID=UPI001C97D40C|nr:S8 family serine peptidase [Fictibacillus nanhaiensis]MBY6037459.1 S8 family serine peptidase [Fictibacillus nanhaiensis]
MKRFLRKSSSITLACTFLFSAFSGASAAPNEQTPELAPLYGKYNLSSSHATKVIVEIKEPSVLEAKKKGQKQTKTNLKTKRDAVIKEIAARTNKYEVNNEYDHVFSGFSLELPANEIPDLLAVPGVKAVYPDVAFHVTGEDTGELSFDEVSPQMMNSAPFIGANKAWESGYTGEGVTVAVIDTGVDYTHPDLDQAFGSYKGYDFVDNDNDPQETPKGDSRGAETTHGTHVAGTVAADGGIKGVAPDATLLAYRVLGPGGSGTTENVIAGIERAVEDGADVMNLSLGNSLNNPDWATSIALDQAMSDGVVAVTSNGNSGPKNWTVGSPGTSREAISVGATQLPFNLFTSTLKSGNTSFGTAKVMGFPSDEAILALNGQTLPIVYVGLAAPSDFVGKDLQGKIALVERGAYAFVDKATNAKNAGAVGMVIYNNASGEIPVNVPGMAVPTIKLSREQGLELKGILAQKPDTTVTFGTAFDKTVGETMADFSSRGPVMDTWMIKPDVSAPGVNIVSTVPTHDPANPHGYGAKQGTSMASPHVAGAAALILQAHPAYGVDDVKAALMNTAVNLFDATGIQYPHNTQGAGSIRVVDAIDAETLVTPGSHSFGTFEKLKGKEKEAQKFTIKNLSNKTKKYTFEVDLEGVKVTTSKNLNIPANKSKDVNFRIKVEASKMTPGYHEGTIRISDGSNVIEVPTILFVQEPDFPSITHFSATALGNNAFTLSAYLPAEAEKVELILFNANLSQSIGTIGTYENVPKEFNDFHWDGKLLGEPVPAGNYRVVAFAYRGAKQDYKYTDVITLQ